MCYMALHFQPPVSVFSLPSDQSEAKSHNLDIFMAALHFWVQKSIMVGYLMIPLSLIVLSTVESVGRQRSPGKMSQERGMDKQT